MEVEAGRHHCAEKRRLRHRRLTLISARKRDYVEELDTDMIPQPVVESRRFVPSLKAR